MNEIINKKGKEVVALFLDEEFTLSRPQLLAVGWDFVPIYQSLDPLQAEWLSNAILETTTSKNIVAIDVEYKSDPKAIEIEVTRDAILKYIFQSTGNVIFTNHNIDFLFFRDQLNRYSVICGNKEFLKKAYPSSSDSMKVMFFYYCDDNYVLSLKEKEFYKNVWEKYSNL